MTPTPKRDPWPDGTTVTLKCESPSLCFDQFPFRLTLREETEEAWVGWPLSWEERGVPADTPLVFPKFAWIRVP